MEDLESIKFALYDRVLSKVADGTGLSVPTIRAIRDGTNTNPTLETLEKIKSYLGQRK